MKRFALCCAALILSSCLRSPAEIDPPGKGVTITGTIVERDAGSGVLRPVERARVSAIGASPADLTNNDGFFQVPSLPVGVVRLKIERPAIGGARPLPAKVLGGIQALIDGQSIALGQIELLGTGDVIGQVELADDRSPGAAEGSLVVLAQTAFRAVVDRQGAFELLQMPEGQFDLVVYRSGYAPARAQVTVEPGEVKRIPLLALSPQLAGEGTFMLSGSALRSDQLNLPEGQPGDHSGISVRFLSETSSMSAPIEATTAADGGYKVTLSYGVYRAEVRRDGYVPLILEGIAVLREGVIGLVPAVLVPQGAGDLDGDGEPDASDVDRDGDGCPNESDNFPDDLFRCGDLDGDTIDDAIDADDDGDTLSDAEETSSGRDGAITNPRLADTDADGARDDSDVCPAISDPAQLDSDDDGRGDACDEEAVITGFTPGSGAAGQTITVFGRNFYAALPQANIVSFGDEDAIGRVESGSDTVLVVNIPRSAVTGPISVDNGISSATSTGTFVRIREPSIFSVTPRRVARGGTILVLGEDFEGSPEILVGGTRISTTQIGDIGGRAALRGTIPQAINAGSYAVGVSAAGGTTTSNFTIEVLADITISGFSPVRAGIGQRVQVFGTGFETDGQSGPVVVEFTGGATADATNVGPVKLEVIVPAGARTGPIRVRHPSGLTVVSAASLIVDAALGVILDVDPTLVRPAVDTLAISGSNLDRAVLVRFSGGVSAAPSMITASRISVAVPAGVMPGPVYVDLMPAGGGTVTATAPLPIHVLPDPTVLSAGATVQTMDFSADGAVLYTMQNTSAVFRDSTTLMEVSRVTVNFPGAATYEDLTVAPNGMRAALRVLSGGGTVYVVGLPRFDLIARCDDVFRTSSGERLQFSADSRVVFGRHQATSPGFAYFDADDMVCGSMQTIAGMNRHEGLLASESGGTLLALHPMFGMAVVDADPSSPTFDQVLQPYDMMSWPIDVFFWPPLEGAQTPRLFPGSDVYGTDTNTPVTRYATSPPAVLSPVNGSNGTLAIAQSRDGRWMVRAMMNTLLFIDLVENRVAARFNIGGIVTEAAAHPSEPVFAVLFANQNLRRFEILEAP